MDRDREIRKETTVSASGQEVWKAWTTEKGLMSFFPPKCDIELKVGGKYEMYFMLDNEPGMRGGEGCQIMAMEPETMLSFTWNAPPQFPNVREQKTFVVLRFQEKNRNETHVSLRHYGWGESEEWTATYNYFDAAWGRVLESLKDRY